MASPWPSGWPLCPSPFPLAHLLLPLSLPPFSTSYGQPSSCCPGTQPCCLLCLLMPRIPTALTHSLTLLSGPLASGLRSCGQVPTGHFITAKASFGFLTLPGRKQHTCCGNVPTTGYSHFRCIEEGLQSFLCKNTEQEPVGKTAEKPPERWTESRPMNAPLSLIRNRKTAGVRS